MVASRGLRQLECHAQLINVPRSVCKLSLAITVARRSDLPSCIAMQTPTDQGRLKSREEGGGRGEGLRSACFNIYWQVSRLLVCRSVRYFRVTP